MARIDTDRKSRGDVPAVVEIEVVLPESIKQDGL
jgi:hypothetical protein